MACLVAARARGGRIHIVTRNPDGLAAEAARTDPNSRVFILPVVDAKDGFLATHSLLATVLALWFARDAASEDRKCVVWGKRGSVRVALGGSRIIKKKKI